MSILEWVGFASIMIGLFIGLIYVLRSADNKKKHSGSKKNDVKSSYNNKPNKPNNEFNRYYK